MGKLIPFPPPEEPHYSCPDCGSAWFTTTVAFERKGFGNTYMPSSYVSAPVDQGPRCLSCGTKVDPNDPSPQR